MRAAGRMSGLVLAASLAACTYGPVVDRSGVQSAAVLPDGETVAVAYQVLRYRPAQGISAFPDGGIPAYLDDRILIAAATEGGRVRVLQRVQNRGVDGSAAISLRTTAADPQHVLVLYSEQPSTARASERRLWRLNLATGQVSSYPDLAADLARQGRRLGAGEFGDVRVVAADGSLLIGADTAEGSELWVWTPAGGYRRLDPLKHFYGVAGDETYYWSGDEARVRNWRTGASRVIARYDPAVRQTSTLRRRDPTVEAIERPQPRSPSLAWRGAHVTLTSPEGATRTWSLDRAGTPW